MLARNAAVSMLTAARGDRGGVRVAPASSCDVAEFLSTLADESRQTILSCSSRSGLALERCGFRCSPMTESWPSMAAVGASASMSFMARDAAASGSATHRGRDADGRERTLVPSIRRKSATF